MLGVLTVHALPQWGSDSMRSGVHRLKVVTQFYLWSRNTIYSIYGHDKSFNLIFYCIFFRKLQLSCFSLHQFCIFILLLTFYFSYLLKNWEWKKSQPCMIDHSTNNQFKVII